MNGYSNNETSSTAMNGRSSMSNTTDAPVVDSLAKEKGNGFLSFLARLGGRRASLPHIPLLSSFNNSDSSNAHVTPSPKSPSSKQNIPLSSPKQNSLDAPALFVAYPQAIKAASLAALPLSSDTFLRRNTELKTKEKDKKGRFMHRGRSGSKTDFEWTKKMFLLIPSMLLQYNADGAVDRMPEKILQLTSQSVAFASDVIPGKPYVLQVQVSQGPGANGLPIFEEKDKIGTLFARFSFKNQTKHLALSFLLVFDSAKEMDSWLRLIRAEIAKLAGTYVPEKEQPRPIPRALTRKITIKREEDDLFDIDAASKRYSRFSRSSRPSLDAATSFTGTVASEGQIALDNLRGSSRVSMQSNGRVTIPTISPESSPERYSSRPETTLSKLENDRRRSTFSTSIRSRTSFELKSQRPRPLSTIEQPLERTMQTPMTRTPSPISFPKYQHTNLVISRRYSNGSLGIAAPPIATRSFSLPSGGPTIDSHTLLKYPPRRSSLVHKFAEEDKIPDLPPSARSPRRPNRLDLPRRARPVSMVDTKSFPDLSNFSESQTTASFSNIQARVSRSQSHHMQRRSMTALAVHSPVSSFSISPPSHPPPSIPLPKLPLHLTESHGLRQRYPLETNAVVTSTCRTSRLGTRHSFHGVRPGGERYA